MIEIIAIQIIAGSIIVGSIGIAAALSWRGHCRRQIVAARVQQLKKGGVR
jgi:hypothetical protein